MKNLINLLILLCFIVLSSCVSNQPSDNEPICPGSPICNKMIERE